MFWTNSFREEFVGRDLSLFVALLFKLLVDSPLVVAPNTWQVFDDFRV
jgi:hypothetical protein